MKTKTRVGGNRTGLQMSPKHSKDMFQGSPRAMPVIDTGAMDELRRSYIREADPVGSMPPPGSVGAVLQSGAQMLTGNRAHVFIDKLGERLAFERTGTRLYEALLLKCEAAGDAAGPVAVDRLRHFRNEEAAHFELVASAIEAVGGDPTAQTPCADVAGMEGYGLMQVVTDPRTTVAQCLDAILVAELADNAGWELLACLATEIGKDDFARQFNDALRTEQEHLRTIRQWAEQLTLDLAKIGGGI
jgi:tRNA isopentenyl-2-thiomethyl-A-37 hydroxylase MiaE